MLFYKSSIIINPHGMKMDVVKDGVHYHSVIFSLLRLSLP